MSGYADSTIMSLASNSYYEVIPKENGFLVWTPTAGEHLIENGSIHFDLLNTTYPNYSSLKPLKIFEEFLKHVSQKGKKKDYHRKTIDKLRSSIQSNPEMSAQYLMMLHFTNNKQYYPLFDSLLNYTLTDTRYALATNLGNLNDKHAIEVLIQMLNDTNSIVQGEVVRQLSNENAKRQKQLDSLRNSGRFLKQNLIELQEQRNATEDKTVRYYI